MKSIALQSNLTRSWSLGIRYISVLLALLLLSAQAWAVGTATGTSIPNRASSSFVEEGATKPSEAFPSNEVITKVVTVCSVIVTPNGTVASPAITNSVGLGEKTTFDFELTNTGNGANTITLAAIIDTASDIRPDLVTIRYDSDNDNVVDTEVQGGSISDLPNDVPTLVQVEITMPQTAQAGQKIFVNLSAACQGDPSTTDDDNVVVAVVGDTPADLSLQKAVALTTDADNSTSITVGDTVTFTLTLNNAGPNTATNVVVQDKLPSGYTYVSDNGNGTYDAATGNWTIASLPVSTVTLEIVATVNTSGDYVNKAQVTASDQSDPDSKPNDGPEADSNNDGNPDDDGAVLDPGIGQVADVSVLKSSSLISDADNNGKPSVGDTLRFTMKVSNAGPNTAKNITVEDILPTGYQYVAGSIAGGDSRNDAAAPTLTWKIDSLANGADSTLSADVVILATGEYKNTVTITSTTPFDPDPSNNTDTDTPAIEAVADLSLTKAVALTQDADGSASITPGDTVTFTLTLNNAGPNTATNVVVQDKLPSGYAYVSDNGSGTYDSSTGNWTIASLPVGDISLEIVATVNASGDYVNTAQVTASDQSDPDSQPNDGPEADSNNDGQPDDDGAVLPNPVGGRADVSIEKSSQVITDADNNAKPSAGDTLRFTMKVRNAGPSEATNITVADILPSGYEYVAGTIAGGDSRDDSAAPNMAWVITKLAVNEEVTLSVDAKIRAQGNYTNTVTITSSTPFDPNPNNNSDTDTPAIDAVADLSLTKAIDLSNDADNSNSITPGDTVIFTLTLTNEGPNDATNVVVRDKLPSGYTYVSDDGNGSYDATTGDWTVASMPVGSKRLKIQATVNPSGDYVNQAEVTASDQFDPDSNPNDGVGADSNNDGQPDDDGATVNPNIGEVADLSLLKSVRLSSDADNSGNITAGDTVIFTLRVSNAGPDTATNVVVRDKLPSGYTYVSDNGSGAYDATTGDWTVGTVPVGDKTLEITVTVNATGNYINQAEVTASDQFDPDSKPNDGPATDANGDGNPDDDGAVLDPGIGEAADVSLQKTYQSVLDADNSGDITPGDILSFTLTIQNNGPNTARNIQVQDILPSGYAYVANTIAGGTSQDDSGAPTLRWTLAGLSVGQTVDLKANVRVLGTGDYNNVASITSSTPFDPNPANNTDNVTPPVKVTPGINNPTKVAAPADGTALKAGDTLRYTISFHTNDLEVKNVVVKDTLSQYLDNLTIVGTDPTATSQAINGRELDVRYDAISANTTVRIVVEGIVTSTFDIDDPKVINPGAVISFDNPDGTPATPIATPSTSHPVTTTGGVTPPRKIVDPSNGTAVEPGDTVTYTISFASRDVALSNVVITDILSANLENLTIVSVTPDATSQAITGQELRVVYATLPAETDVSIVVRGTVKTLPANVDASVQNPGAQVSFDNGTPVTSNPTTNPVNQADIYAEKTSNAVTIAPGSEIIYTIVVGNNGPANAAGISIQDDLPDTLENVTWTCTPDPSDSVRSDCDTNGNGNTASGTGDINIVETARIAAGEKLVFTVKARVRANVPDGQISNVATIKTPSTTTDPDPGNNTSTTTTTVISKCALEIKPDGSVATPAYQQTVPFSETTAFKYTVTNLSNSKHTYDLEPLFLATPSRFTVALKLVLDDGDGVYNPANDTQEIRELSLDVVTDANGNIERGESAVVWIVVTAPAQSDNVNINSAAYVNLRGFCDNDADNQPDNDTNVDDDNVSEVKVVNISLNIEKMAKPEGGTLNAGEDLPYELLLTNNGGFPITNTVVYDPLPKGLTYIENTQEVILYPGESRQRKCTECTFEVLTTTDLDEAKRKEIFEPIASRRLESRGITEDSNPSDYAQLLALEYTQVVNEASGKVLKWANFPVLEPGTPPPSGDTARISFDTSVDASLIFEGSEILNPTSARASSDNNSAAASVAVSAAAAVVPVDPDIIQVGSIILGTAFLDVDDNDIYTEVDIPVQNLRIYLPDGRSTVTDELGRYTFQDLDAGVTSIKVDPITIPGYRLKPTINEIAPGFWRERLYSGLIVRQDIPFEPPRALVAVDETLTAMRGDVMVVKELYVQDNGVLVRLTISSMSALKGLTIMDEMPANARMLSEPSYAGGARGIGAEVAGEGLTLELGDVPAEFNVVVDYLLSSTQAGREKVALTAPIIEWELR